MRLKSQQLKVSTQCHRLNAVSPPNSYADTLPLNVVVLGRTLVIGIK